MFRYPPDPCENYIKRVVGLPGDHVTVRDDQLIINGKPVPFTVTGTYNDGCYINMHLAAEHLGTHTHQALLCPVPLEVTPLTRCRAASAATRAATCAAARSLPARCPSIEPEVVTRSCRRAIT